MRNLKPISAIVALAALATTASAAPPPRPMPPQDFVNAAAQSDAFEILSSQLALAQSSDADVKAFAHQMIEDHTRTSSDLMAAVRASKLQPPQPGISGDQQKMLSALQSAKGADLDKSFVTQQVAAHAGALATEQAYLSSGTDPNLRKAAQGAVPVIERHLDMARRMKATKG